MTKPLELDTILAEFDDSAQAWVLQDRNSGKYLIVPDPRFPGRKPVRFFMRQEDAEALLTEVLEANPSLRDKEIYPTRVALIRALRGIASDTNPNNADSFVVHSPNEVYEFLRDRP
jgi:hypothetical protein